MKRETRERALRSAAQISFLSLPLTAACGSTYQPVKDAGSASYGDGDERDDGPLTPDECKAALKAAYPNGDPNWFNSASPTKRVDTGVTVAKLVQCCSELPPSADEGSGGGGTYRDSGCCSLNNEVGGVDKVGLACTPWGPPMPRAMRRRGLGQRAEVLS